MSIKKSIVIILAIVIVGIVAYVFLHSGSSPSATPNVGQTGSLPGVASSTVVVPSFFETNATVASGTKIGSVSIVGPVRVAAYFVNASSAVIIVQTDGEIIGLTGGQITTLSSSTIDNLVAAKFSYDGQKIVVSTGSVSDPVVNIFNATTSSWMSLGGGVISPAWAPSDARLAYLRDSGNGAETVMMIDFSKPKPTPVALGTFFMQDMGLTWINKDNLSLVSHPSAYTNGSALVFNISKKTLSPVLVDQPGLETMWSGATSSSTGVSFFANQSERGGHLQLINLQGVVLQNIAFLTLPTKCIFAAVPAASTSTVTVASSTTVSSTMLVASSSLSAIRYPLSALYCAVPRDQATLSYYDLPDAYEQNQIFTSDDLYRVDTTTGHIDTLFSDQAQNFDMTDVSIVGSSAFFVNRYDQKLYAVRIQ